MKTSNQMQTIQTESTEAFLARGGKIQRLPIKARRSRKASDSSTEESVKSRGIREGKSVGRAA